MLWRAKSARHWAMATKRRRRRFKTAGNRSGDRPQDIIVLAAVHDTTCKKCRIKIAQGGFLRKSKKRLCLACGGLDHLVFLPRGDTALTRRALKHSAQHAVVIRITRNGRRKERQGVLVGAAARTQAERECLADAGVRERARARAAERRAVADARYLVQFAERLGELFPGCPAPEREIIVAHACEKHSRRIGRSAAARRLDPVAVATAVRAHIRHRHTPYDQLRKEGSARAKARAAVSKAVDRLAKHWRQRKD